MFFLGQASNLTKGQILRHTFAFGGQKNSEKLRSHLAKRYSVPEENVTFYHTGRTALAGALKTITKNTKNPKVLVTSLTCYAVVEAVRAAGATPVFADVDSGTLHFNKKTLESALKLHNNICAIVVQNNLGHPCKIREIEKVAKKHNLPIIEDLAHCAGICYDDGREAGTVGVAAALSFGKGKSIDTTSGGALILRDKSLAGDAPEQPTHLPSLPDRLRDRFYPLFGLMIRGFYHIRLGRLFTSLLLKLHFIQRSADAVLDFGQRLPHWQAKLALSQFERLPENRPPLREFFFVEDREKVLSELEKSGFIMQDIWYTTPVSPERYFKKSGFKTAECPVAVTLSEHIINLPTYYPRTKLQPARLIIEKYPLKEAPNEK